MNDVELIEILLEIDPWDAHRGKIDHKDIEDMQRVIRGLQSKLEKADKYIESIKEWKENGIVPDIEYENAD